VSVREVGQAHVRFGSKADMTRAGRNVRYWPKADIPTPSFNVRYWG
jgi:hypothetical protein